MTETSTTGLNSKIHELEIEDNSKTGELNGDDNSKAFKKIKQLRVFNSHSGRRKTRSSRACRIDIDVNVMAHT